MEKTEKSEQTDVTDYTEYTEYTDYTSQSDFPKNDQFDQLKKPLRKRKKRYRPTIVAICSSLGFVLLNSAPTLVVKYLNEYLHIVFPWFTVMLLTGGWPINLFFFIVRYMKRKSRHKLSRWSFGAYAFLGFLDALRMSLMSFGMNYLSGSTYMVLKGTNVIFVVIMTKMFLPNRVLMPLHWLSVVFFAGSMGVLAVGGEENQSHHTTSKNYFLIGFICTITSSFVNSAQSIIAEKYFRKLKKDGRSFTRASELASFNGLFSFLFASILPFAVGEHQQWIKTFSSQSFQNKHIIFIVCCLLIFASSQPSYLFKFSLTDFLSAFFVAILNMIRRLLVVILCVILYNESFGWSKIVSIVLMMIGFVLYLYASRNAKKIQQKENVKDPENKPLIVKTNQINKVI
ncbi:hypothetical protein M0813_03067 [Anaeramoeba flamelloides]|uniref:Uncharacterized protein n=1 Tax=Anaeramoeba flamelloides TaxID=1746091 RepID=A0AAV8AI89_9EUKA|nr:hypothetical protein M0812_04344 [Anaeramoeba flamelloides]KAJ6240600.1 hypothetical protein M0813_03067 [Anaeramoeba flamelloides]